MANVRATANPFDPNATAEVGGIEIDQFFNVNVDTSDKAVKQALKDGLITQMDNAEYDEDEQAAQLAAIEEYKVRIETGGATPDVEPAEEQPAPRRPAPAKSE